MYNSIFSLNSLLIQKINFMIRLVTVIHKFTDHKSFRLSKLPILTYYPNISGFICPNNKTVVSYTYTRYAVSENKSINNNINLTPKSYVVYSP